MTVTTQAIPRRSKLHAPSPSGHFLLGNVRALRQDILGTFSTWRAEYGDIVRYRIASRHQHLISHPEFVREVFVQGRQTFDRPGEDLPPRGLRLVINTGLLGAEGPFWLRQRRMMQPIFHRRRIGKMAQAMTDCGEEMLARWATYDPNQPIDLNKEMMAVTLDIISQTMFSAKVMGHVDKVEKALQIVLRFAFDSIQMPLFIPLALPTPRNREFKRALDTLDQIIYGIIQQRRASTEEHDDLLAMLLEARDEESGEGMDDAQLRHEVLTIFGAGHETTANALTWTWYLLAQHPEILQRLQTELKETLAGRTPTLKDLRNLPYCKQVLEEAMRLYPPAPILARRVREDTTLNGYDIPSNSFVVASIYNIHRHPDFWPEPEKFDPERFTPENSQTRHRYAYMPFGAGQHLCIGNQFALMEGQLLLAQMAQKYELRLLPEHVIEKEVAITLRPRNGMKMTLHPVN